MLFLTSAFLVAAVAATVLALEEDPNGYVPIGTAFVLAAGATYAARGYLEKRNWKRLSMTTLIAVIALILAVLGVRAADVTCTTVWATVRGFLGVSVAAMAVTLLMYVLRIAWLGMMYCRKRQIVKNVKSGEYAAAVNVAEGGEPCVGGVEGTDYVKNPEKLSESVALPLSCALTRVGRGKDAERVSEVSRLRKLS